MLIDTTPFPDFNLFFSWYINVIKARVDNFNVGMGSDEIHLLVGNLTKEEKDFTDKTIRKIQRIPKGIVLINDNKAGTFYSCWDKSRGKAVIAYPSVTYYWLRFPEMIKVAMQHEIGHIINNDITYHSENGAEWDMQHSQCLNRSMDCRINQNLNYDTLDYINRCLFTFANVPTDLIVPETFFPKCGLPISWKGMAKMTYIHLKYHDVNPKPLDEDEEQDVRLRIGSYVKTSIEKYSVPSGTYGVIVSITPKTAILRDYGIAKISQEEIDALENEDYKFFERLDGSKPTVSSFGDYQYNNEVKEITPLNKPIRQQQEPPQCGDIALTIMDVNSIPQATFCIVMDVVDEGTGEYTLNEFSSDLQRIIGKGDAKTYFEKMQSGQDDIFTVNVENAIFKKDFILRKLSPPPTSPPPPPPPDAPKPVDLPNEGDVVYIEKGTQKGKYGVIDTINEDGTYTITEVSEDVVNAMFGKKA